MLKLMLVVLVLSLQVDSTYPELAELLLVVLKTLLNKSPEFEVDSGRSCLHSSHNELEHQCKFSGYH